MQVAAQEFDTTLPSIDSVRNSILYINLISFGLEEMKLTLDLFSRIGLGLKTQHIHDSQDPHVRITPLTTSIVISNERQTRNLSYTRKCKSEDIELFSVSLFNSYSNLLAIIDAEQHFFGGLAFDLMESFWVLQGRNWNSFKGNIYVDYGFRNGEVS
jgi:hypothetical protein